MMTALILIGFCLALFLAAAVVVACIILAGGVYTAAERELNDAEELDWLRRRGQ